MRQLSQAPIGKILKNPYSFVGSLFLCVFGAILGIVLQEQFKSTPQLYLTETRMEISVDFQHSKGFPKLKIVYGDKTLQNPSIYHFELLNSSNLTVGQPNATNAITLPFSGCKPIDFRVQSTSDKQIMPKLELRESQLIFEHGILKPNEWFSALLVCEGDAIFESPSTRMANFSDQDIKYDRQATSDLRNYVARFPLDGLPRHLLLLVVGAGLLVQLLQRVRTLSKPARGIMGHTQDIDWAEKKQKAIELVQAAQLPKNEELVSKCTNPVNVIIFDISDNLEHSEDWLREDRLQYIIEQKPLSEHLKRHDLKPEDAAQQIASAVRSCVRQKVALEISRVMPPKANKYAKNLIEDTTCCSGSMDQIKTKICDEINKLDDDSLRKEYVPTPRRITVEGVLRATSAAGFVLINLFAACIVIWTGYMLLNA